MSNALTYRLVSLPAFIAAKHSKGASLETFVLLLAFDRALFLCSLVVDQFISIQPLVVRAIASFCAISQPSTQTSLNCHPLRNLTRNYANLRLVKRNPKTMRTFLNSFYTYESEKIDANRRLLTRIDTMQKVMANRFSAVALIRDCSILRPDR
ncbi:MAG TPA: hypothetical protein VGN23_03035 [Verrucomicrobiae bacterium]|jgi:hypothetical protein